MEYWSDGEMENGRMTDNKTFSPGFTLIEIVAMLVVAAIVLPALILPFTESVRELNKPVIAGTLALLAQEEMEKKVVPVQSFSEVTGWGSTPFTAPFGEYSSTGSVNPDVSFGLLTAGLKEVTVTVTHSDGQSLSLVTVKSNWRRLQE
jgi:type II secretory pathway pseudopilin PulG